MLPSLFLPIYHLFSPPVFICQISRLQHWCSLFLAPHSATMESKARHALPSCTFEVVILLACKLDGMIQYVLTRIITV